jgi:hypothetical protein
MDIDPRTVQILGVCQFGHSRELEIVVVKNFEARSSEAPF